MSTPPSRTVHLSQSQFWEAHKLPLAKISKKQTLLESLFEKGERPNDEIAEDSKTANRKKAAFKRKYQESYLNYRFRASLVAQWLRICLPMQGMRVRALVWEDPTYHGATGPVSHNH